MNGEYEVNVDGDDKPTLKEAFESAGEKAEKQLESDGVPPDDRSRRRWDASINVETQPQNQWIKAYKVKLGQDR